MSWSRAARGSRSSDYAPELPGWRSSFSRRVSFVVVGGFVHVHAALFRQSYRGGDLMDDLLVGEPLIRGLQPMEVHLVSEMMVQLGRGPDPAGIGEVIENR